jgi:hypothetical protein
MNFYITGNIKIVALSSASVPSTTIAAKKMRIEYSDDKGATWKTYGTSMTFPLTTMTSQKQRVEMDGTFRFRVIGIERTEGYIDNFTIRYEPDQPTAIQELPTEKATNIRLYKEGEALHLVGKQEIRQVRVYSVSGALVYAAETRSEHVAIPCGGWMHGVYIVEASTSEETLKQKVLY